jgi:hypothetical protein
MHGHDESIRQHPTQIFNEKIGPIREDSEEHTVEIPLE